MRRLLPLLLVLTSPLVVAPSAHAVATMSVHDPITDNYKASYNADPSVQERRTWLAWRHLVAGGTTWTPADRSALIVSQVAVEAADGRSGTLTLRRVSGAADSLSLRVDALTAESGGRWGPLITVPDVDGRFAPIRLNLTLTVNGVVLALGRVTYGWDRALANAPASSIEHNGPGGRWLVGATRTRTDQEAAPTPPPTVLAAFPPRITSVRVPVSTTSRSIILRLTTVAGTSRVTRVRFSVAGRAYGRWLPIASTWRITLPSGTATRAIRVQVRDARGLASTVVTRRVRCSC